MRQRGDRDTPGAASLPDFHPALWVGNEVAASHNATHGSPYAVVLSTVTPVHSTTFQPEQSLTTHAFLFEDRCGREKPADRAVAAKNIVAGAKALDAAINSLSDGETALVHCSWGQNRSNAICVAWAVLYRGWRPEDAIAYAQRRCKAGRHYEWPRPLFNEVFCSILRQLEPSTTGDVVRKPTGLTAWLKPKKRPREHE